MSHDRKPGFLRAFDPSFALGTVCTIAFYAVINQPPLRDSVLHRYTSEHVVEYAIVALFIWGVIDILLKLLFLPREILALRQEWLPPRVGREPAANAAALLEHVRSQPRWLQSSRVARRLTQALDYVTESGSAEDYREHLQYLSDQDDDNLQSNYMLVRFVAGVTPVLGFLGTVVHFGTALSGISFNEMAQRLSDVVGEMGSAFNTTTVALAAAMTMLFSLFICERIERSVGRSIDRLVDRELLTRFEVKDPNILPFLAAVESANEESLRSISTNLHRQTEVWSQSLDTLYERFDQRQQQELDGWREALEILRERHEAYDAGLEERLRQTLALVDSRQDQHMAQIQMMLERAVSVRDDLTGLMKTLESIARGEGKLVELQASLTENLRVLRESQQIDQAMHGLTAAIHLLTARHRQSGGFDSAAA
jgi:biopolymer transport protein ExbB/TolQ